MFEVVSCNVHKFFFFNCSFPFVLNRLAKKRRLSGWRHVGFLLVLKRQLKVGADATTGYPKQCLLDIFLGHPICSPIFDTPKRYAEYQSTAIFSQYFHKFEKYFRPQWLRRVLSKSPQAAAPPTLDVAALGATHDPQVNI